MNEHSFNLAYKEQEPFYIDALYMLGVRSEDFKRLGETDLACACPICGDSKYGKKRRLHFYQKSTVINVNCFNGDCSVKNMTLWSFLKMYSPRIFNSFKDFVRGKYLNEIGSQSKTKEKPKLESFELDDFDFDISETPKEISKLYKFIEAFEKSSTSNDLEKIKQFLKENPSEQVLFKQLLEK